jgi:hypothetical protein
VNPHDGSREEYLVAEWQYGEPEPARMFHGAREEYLEMSRGKHIRFLFLETYDQSND